MIIDSSSNFQLAFIWGHSHSTYTQRGRGGVKPNEYDCVQGGKGGGGQGCVHTQKKSFWSTKFQNFPFSVQKKLLHCYLLFCIGKCKPVLSYK